jgi:hypothetical protein
MTAGHHIARLIINKNGIIGKVGHGVSFPDVAKLLSTGFCGAADAEYMTRMANPDKKALRAIKNKLMCNKSPVFVYHAVEATLTILQNVRDTMPWLDNMECGGERLNLHSNLSGAAVACVGYVTENYKVGNIDGGFKLTKDHTREELLIVVNDVITRWSSGQPLPDSDMSSYEVFALARGKEAPQGKLKGSTVKWRKHHEKQKNIKQAEEAENKKRRVTQDIVERIDATKLIEGIRKKYPVNLVDDRLIDDLSFNNMNYRKAVATLSNHDQLCVLHNCPDRTIHKNIAREMRNLINRSVIE